MATPLKAVGYIRVSTTIQAEDGVSLDAQRAKLNAFAVAMDLELVEVVSDAGVSGKRLDRPRLTRALAMLERGEVQALCVTKLDRLTRSVRDLGDLLERYFARATLLSVGDAIDTRTAGGRLVLNVLASVSQWEREAIAERTREALGHVRASGARLGGEALGWRRGEQRDTDGRLAVVECADELDSVRRIRELRAAGLSLRAIARALSAEGRATKRASRWAPETVRRILARAERGDELAGEPR